MKQYTGHNKWLNKEPQETMEEYNKRLSAWEEKETNKQFAKVAAYEEVIARLEAELNHLAERKKNIKDYNEDFARGEELTIKGLLLAMTSMKENHKVVGNEPTKYEIKWGGGDDYKLSLRK